MPSIESLLKNITCLAIERDDSMVGFEMDGYQADFHRPHPGKEAKPYKVKAPRDFLKLFLGGVKPMSHRGYVARIEYSDEDKCFVGRVVGIQDIITFHGESVDELLAAFKEAVDFHIILCPSQGTNHKSLNSLVIDALAESTARQGI